VVKKGALIPMDFEICFSVHVLEKYFSLSFELVILPLLILKGKIAKSRPNFKIIDFFSIIVFACACSILHTNYQHL